MNYSDNDTYGGYDYPDICENSPDPTVLPALLYTLSLFSLLGNAAVVWVLVRHVKLKTMTDVCLLNLASSDVITAASLPLWVVDQHTQLSCKVITGVYQLGLFSGSLFVTFMSVDRYLAIVHAVAAMKARSLRYGITISIVIWAISAVMAAPQVTFAGLGLDDAKCSLQYPPNTATFWKKLRNFSENAVTFGVCLPTITFCYVKILRVLAKARNSNKVKAVRLILVIVCLFVVCWVPYNLVVLLQTLRLYDFLNDCWHFQRISAAQGLTEVIALSHCCVNPIVYAFVGEKFQKAIRKALVSCTHRKEQGRGVSAQRDTSDRETTNTPLRSEY